MSNPVPYPISLKLSGRRCVVIGGGEVAARKAADLAAAGASVRVIAPQICDPIRELASSVEIVMREFQPGDVNGAFLVFAATDNPGINRAAAILAQASGALVNIADDPDGSDFYVPSRINRGDLQITVATSGKTPVIAKRIRMELETTYGPEYGRWIDLVSEGRDQLQSRADLDSKRRGEILRTLLDLPLLDLIREGKMEEARLEVARCIWQS